MCIDDIYSNTQILQNMGSKYQSNVQCFVLFLFVVFFMPVKNYENSEQNRFQLLSDSPFFNRDCCWTKFTWNLMANYFAKKKNFKNLNKIIINIAYARKTDLIDIRDEMDRRSGSMAENNLHLFQPQVRFLHFRRHLFRFDVVIVVVVSFVINPCPQCTCEGQTARCPI